MSSSKKTSSVNKNDLLSELMSNECIHKPLSANEGWSNMKDSFEKDDNWTQSFFQQEAKVNMNKVGLSF